MHKVSNQEPPAQAQQLPLPKELLKTCWKPNLKNPLQVPGCPVHLASPSPPSPKSAEETLSASKAAILTVAVISLLKLQGLRCILSWTRKTSGLLSWSLTLCCIMKNKNKPCSGIRNERGWSEKNLTTNSRRRNNARSKMSKKIACTKTYKSNI